MNTASSTLRRGVSTKISQAKALVRFSRYGAAQEAARKENWIKIGRKQGVGFFPGFVLLFAGFDVVREDSQFDGLRWSERTRVTSPRRPRFAVSGLGTPVRSEIGRYRALAERVTILNHPGNLGCGYAGLGPMRVRVRGSSDF